MTRTGTGILVTAGLLSVVALFAFSGSDKPASGFNESTPTDQKRAQLIDLVKNDGAQAGKPFVKMGAPELDDCYKYMFYYMDILHAGKNKVAMPQEFQTRIAAISVKWNIFT